MERLDDVRRPILIAAAALLVVLGLILALSAPGAAPASNKAQGYGDPLPTKPTNPRSPAACNDYYGGEGRKTPDGRACRAKGARNAGNRKCKKKSGAAKTKCRKAVKRKYKKALKAIKKQRAAEKACSDAYNRDSSALDPNDPQYSSKQEALGKTFQACLAKAR